MGVLKDHAGGKYLRSEDIDGVGLEHGRTVTIADFTEADVSRETDDHSELKPIIHFADDGIKPMVLNKTNLNFILGHFGDQEKLIIGKKVLIWVDDNVQYAGKRVKGLRLAENTIQAAVTKAQEKVDKKDFAPDPNDDIPF